MTFICVLSGHVQVSITWIKQKIHSTGLVGLTSLLSSVGVGGELLFWQCRDLINWPQMRKSYLDGRWSSFLSFKPTESIAVGGWVGLDSTVSLEIWQVLSECQDLFFHSLYDTADQLLGGAPVPLNWLPGRIPMKKFPCQGRAKKGKRNRESVDFVWRGRKVWSINGQLQNSAFLIIRCPALLGQVHCSSNTSKM